MMYLGSERTIIEPFFQTKTGESYQGVHKSDVKIYGTGKVIKVINRFHSYENAIVKETFLKNQETWKIEENTYQVTSVHGTEFTLTEEELMGNQLWIETKEGDSTIVFHLSHLDDVLVNVGDIVKETTLLGHQGNTGIVDSSCDITDFSYGSILLFEVEQDGKKLNPRGYAEGTIKTNYPILEEKNVIPILLFEAQKEDYYYLYLKAGEKIYLEKTMP